MFVLNIVGCEDETWDTDQEKYPDAAVIAYCHFLYSEGDGWEWMRNDHARTKIRCVNTLTNEETFHTFELEYEPSFYITDVSP